MNIQFVRLDHDVCETVNRIALERRRTVSDLVNEMLRECLIRVGRLPSRAPAGGFQTPAIVTRFDNVPLYPGRLNILRTKGGEDVCQ